MHVSHSASSTISSSPSLFGNKSGLAFLELLIVVGIIGLLATVSIPKIDQHALDLKARTDGLAGNLRLARAWATSRGTHFQVTLTASSYTIQRMQDEDGDGEWTADADAPGQDFILPNRISLSTSDQSAIEFTTRGQLVPGPGEQIASVQEVTLRDTTNGKTRQILIWPSGQIQEP